MQFLLDQFGKLSESGYSGFWDFQDGSWLPCYPGNPGILQTLIQTSAVTWVTKITMDTNV
jgi:hypothetical protein